MAKFLVAIHHPDNYDPSTESKAMSQDIDALNDEMVAAGIRVFVGGLHSVAQAKSLQKQSNGEVANLEEALEWGRKAVIACRAPVEVRRFH